MRTGKMNRYITIETPTVTQDSFGGEVTTWATFAVVWAARVDMKARERFNSDQIQAKETTTWRIRWLINVQPDMRITYSGKVYEIIGLAELGRTAGLEITTEARDVSNA